MTRPRPAEREEQERMRQLADELGWELGSGANPDMLVATRDSRTLYASGARAMVHLLQSRGMAPEPKRRNRLTDALNHTDEQKGV